MKMISKKILCCMMLTVFMTAGLMSNVLAETPAVNPAENSKPAHSIIVTYFHTNMRCPTCHKIEELSTQAVKSHFEKELSTGKVVWRVINVDEPENAHYNKDYQLYTKSLIVSEVKDGKEVRWKNLEKIWEFVRDEEEFDKYVHAEIQDWLKG